VFNNVSAKYPKWNLKIAGGGNEGLFFLKGLVSELELDKKVHFLGHVSNLDLELQKASIFVLGSKYEGFPMGLIEAMSQGVACVSYDCVSGPREIINDGVDGILVEDQNMKKMEEAICALIDDDVRRKKLGEAGLINIQRFSIDKIGDRWIKLLETVAGKSYS